MIDPTKSYRSRYNLDEIAEKFNMLSDIRAVHSISHYPRLLFDPKVYDNIQELGFMFVDAEEGSGDVSIVPTPISQQSPTKRFKVLYLNIYNTHRKNAHSNLLLFDSLHKTMERFEPHGSDQSALLTDFSNFYNPVALDRLLVSWARTLKYSYIAPPKEYPVMGQSLSRNDSHWNTESYPSAFKRNVKSESGDSFCSAWTVYYLLLRTHNPDKPMLEIYEYLLGAEQQKKTTDMFRIQGYDIKVQFSLGRRAADTIAGFILFAYSRYEGMSRDPIIINAVLQLDE
jgi:hypothetical protein